MVAPALMSSSSAVGSMSAAAGAVVAKLLCADSDVQAHGQRLEEVKRQATQSSPAAIDPVVAVRHMLETVDWGLANEGRFRLHRASDFLKECLTLRWKEESEAQVLNGSIEKEYERHLHKVRHLCIAPSSKKAPVLRPKVYSAHSVEQPTEKDGSQRLFDPQHGTVRDKLGLCAALAYVVYEFLQLRHAACGSLQDSPRRSLRLALTALSQHDALAKGKEGESTASLGGTQKGHSWWQKAACAETDFRSAAITLICILDAALSWSPLDVFGWTGKPEDVESALLARQRDACSFSFFAEKLRTCLKTACSDSLKATSRIDFHFAAMRRRDLPKEWTTAWVRNDAGPMIVRNRTQVPLRIELRQANQAEDHKAGSIAGMLLDMFQPVSDQPVLAAHVEPGIEWAFRPKKEAGREFQLHMLTTSGVQVCSRRLARGESFDFHVEVPAKPAQLRTWMRAKKDVEFELEQLVASRRLRDAECMVDTKMSLHEVLKDLTLWLTFEMYLKQPLSTQWLGDASDVLEAAKASEHATIAGTALARFLNKEWEQHPPPNGRLDWPKEEDGIQLQITTNNYVCDEEARITPWEGIQLDKENQPPRPDVIPITFGRFDVQDADVIDVFNALADTKGEAEWDDLLMNGPGVTYLGDFPQEFARAAAVSFVARPFPDRQVYQWMVYNSSKSFDDMMVVYSTRRNAELYKRGVEPEGWPAVQAQNCLGAYHVVALPQGGCHVVFTTMVNSHPPWPITAQFVFNIAWTKTAEYIQKLRARAQLLKRRRLAAGAPVEPAVPRWMLFDGMLPNKTESGNFFVEGVPKVNPPFQGPDYVVDVIQIDLLNDLLRIAKSGGLSSTWLCALLVVALVASAAAVWRRRRLQAWQSLAGDELEKGLSPAFAEQCAALILKASKTHVDTIKSPSSPIPEFYLEIAENSPHGQQKKGQIREMSDAVAEIHASFCAFQEQNQIFAPAAPVPLPVLIVTGSLGSGKTTLMKRLMNRRANLRIAALAHDLASKLNIDASFLAAEMQPGMGKGEYMFQSSAWRDGEVAGLSGCACCPGFDDALSLAVKTALREGADRGLLDYLLLETSGAADPRQIVAALEVRFGPLARARLDRVVTVVDAERVLSEGQHWLDQATQASASVTRRDEFQLQLAQLSVADVILLNKVDLCKESGKALELLQRLCPQAKVLSCCYGDVPVPELLDVVPAPPSASTTVSHEDIPSCWQVSTSLESSRESRTAQLPGGPAKLHHRVLEWSTHGENKPVQLGRLQHMLCVHIPRVRQWLRRAKGVLWVAEDPRAKWEWELSGQLRYSCRRTPSGFGGAQAFSSLVLIFAHGVPDVDLLEMQKVLDDLTAHPPQMSLQKDILQPLMDGSPDFEILDTPSDQPDGCMRFRLTGRKYFHLSNDTDLSEPPYRIDLDTLNRDLAQLVSAEKGGIFLATGEGICKDRGQRVLALLWPLACWKHPEGVPTPLQVVLAAARAVAPVLLQQYFGHVTSCHCGQ
ncbi:unnamed protein product [Symbiodinium pilosum]|uniref:CobW/HypB/UreG nucleotide-binding domain-containing protein n=1 Tax=Symbiodinium pilosum TaxID=2952 RepID=A0A812WAX9_SYMPI|nr:unnamed protein product [Symbiodinium pilosum]